MCPSCGGCVTVCDSTVRLYIQYVHRLGRTSNTRLLHSKVRDFSCHSIGNESPQRHSRSIDICNAVPGSLIDGTEHVRVSTHTQAGAGHYDKRREEVIFPSNSQLAEFILHAKCSDQQRSEFQQISKMVFNDKNKQTV